MRFFYTLSIYAYSFYIHAGSLFNKKAKRMVAGRKNIFEDLRTSISALRTPDSALLTPDSALPAPDSVLTTPLSALRSPLSIYWFHCASLGEFEQGRPLMEKIKLQQPETKILLTFFSPSGYEVRKNYPGADLIYYLPMDSPSNAKRFVELVQPSKVFFVKYEFWFNYLNELKKKNIPTYLVSGIFREDHHFFKSSGGWFRNQLSAFTHFFLQDPKSVELLNSIGYKNTTLTGDTRFDRVAETAKQAKQIDLVSVFAGGKKVFVLGSSWPEDEKLLSGFKLQEFKLIIAPHEIDESHLLNIEEKFVNSIRFSRANESAVTSKKVLIIDNVGMLSSLYKYGSIAFIGGGFGKGIHNILEAATFGMPVIFGPNYHKFAEAKELLKLGGAFSVSSEAELERTLKLLSDEQVLKTAGQISRMYVHGKVGATDKILSAV